VDVLLLYLGFLAAVLEAFALLHYLRSSVAVDATGITQYRVLGSRWIAWSDVVAYGQDWRGFHVDGAEGGAIRFWMHAADVAELKEEIGRRSVNSRNREWSRSV
jgi:hypothetical protein